MNTPGRMWICGHVLGAIALSATFYYLALPRNKKEELKDKLLKLEKCKCKAIEESK